MKHSLLVFSQYQLTNTNNNIYCINIKLESQIFI